VKLDRDRAADPVGKEAVEELTSEARALRAHAREASARIQELEGRLREKQHEPGVAPSPAPAAWESERSELRERVVELKSLIAEGNEERADLRRQLAAASDRARDERPAVATPAPEMQPESERSPDEAVRVRGVMVPRFDPAAEASLRAMPARVVRDALRVIADLCSGEGNVWREIKQLERISPAMYSARIGIHYRVLFRMSPGVLDVAEVVAREGLLAAVRRFWR
jgi:cell division septum initiation protein DivIVA